jgi:hypothetical protein
MRKSSKFILVAGALAALAVPSVASAKVERIQGTTTSITPSVTTATFTALSQPGPRPSSAMCGRTATRSLSTPLRRRSRAVAF